jgi:hypothetical protein
MRRSSRQYSGSSSQIAATYVSPYQYESFSCAKKVDIGNSTADHDLTTFSLLDGATFTGDGPIFDNGVAMKSGAVQAEISGAPSSCIINIMAMLPRSSTFDTIAVLDTREGYFSGEIVPLQPVPGTKFKANLAALTGGINPSVNCWLTLRG